MDTTGTNWVADGMWNQHTESGFWASGTGGTVEEQPRHQRSGPTAST